MNININEAEINQMLGKAILESLSEESRNQILTDAIAHLNTVSSGYGSDRSTPLQRAFREGVTRVTNSLIEDLLKESEHYQRIRAEVAAMIAQFPAVDSDPELKAKILALVLDHVREAQRQLDSDRGY
ncbi:hypothetical protein [Nocardia africana]